MVEPLRKCRRAALLLHPPFSMNEEALDRIAADGFTDIGLTLVSLAPGVEGFDPEQGRWMAVEAHRRGLGVNLFTGYIKYREPLLLAEPHRAMIAYGSQTRTDSDGLPSRTLRDLAERALPPPHLAPCRQT